MGAWRLVPGFVCAAVLFAAVPEGAQIYKARCAACHDHASTRVPPRDSLSKRSPEDVLTALTSGVMREQGLALNDEEKRAAARFVTRKEFARTLETPENRALCPGRPASIILNDSNWNGWGRDVENSRYQPLPGIAAAQVPKLKVKWAFGYPGTFTYGQPTVIGDRLYVTSGSGTVFALNAQTGCTYWTFQSGASTRTAISIGPIEDASGSAYAAFFGDDKAVVYAVNADTGTLLWKTKVDEHPVARITGAPVLYQQGLYVPVSSIEEVTGVNPTYECCRFQGSVARLNPSNGKLLWKTHTMPQLPKPFKINVTGTQLYGPAGAAVWSAPTVDVERNVVYAGTGNSYTEVEQNTADSILAFDLETGTVKWARQVTLRDTFLVGCVRPGNCPVTVGPDVDFGSSPILRRLRNGKQVLLAGQKSGAVFALDPDDGGRILWVERVGAGSALGGVEWGFAADSENAYVAIADAAATPDVSRPGITALSLATGARLWSIPAPRVECSWGKIRCLPAQSQAVTVIPGAVFSGSMDGHLRAYSTRDGSILWDFDTGRPFDTVNGVKASGGSLDGGGPTVANGILYVNSGYGRIVGQGGNVLLAFTVDGR